MSFAHPTLRRGALSLAVVVACLAPQVPLPAHAAKAPALRLRHRDDVLTARVAHFSPAKAGRVRLRVGDRVVRKRIKTNRRGNAVVRFRLSSRKSTVRVVAAVSSDTRRAKLPKKPKQTTPPPPTTTSPPTTTAPPATVQGPFGPDATYAPTGDVHVAVGQLTQALLDAHPSGTQFVLAAGTHRLGTVLRPRAGQQLLGQPDAVLNGATPVSDFRPVGDLWVSSGHPNRYTTHGLCVTGYDACGRTEAVFVNDVPLWQVSAESQLRPGTFLFDRAAGNLVLFDDPSGKKVELTVASAAVAGRRWDGSFANDVVVRNLKVEKFATMAQRGAIDSEGASGWVVERNDVRLNSGAGIIGDSGSILRGNRVVHNGQMGLGGHGNGGLVEGNEIAHNHTNGFDSGWEAGATKWSNTDGLVVRSNYVHHNDGPGLWTDIDNIRTTYADNVVSDNAEAGIFHEISYDAVISGNTVSRNGFRNPRWGYGAGIQISASGNVLITDNVVDRNARGITLIQQARGVGRYGPHDVTNVEVRRNSVTMDTGFTGLVQDVGDLTFFTDHNNRFLENNYQLGAGVTMPFEWRNGLRSPAEWRGFHATETFLSP